LGGADICGGLCRACMAQEIRDDHYSMKEGHKSRSEAHRDQQFPHGQHHFSAQLSSDMKRHARRG
jgi:hypothetical protein